MIREYEKREAYNHFIKSSIRSLTMVKSVLDTNSYAYIRTRNTNNSNIILNANSKSGSNADLIC